MRLSTRARYALHIVLDVARHEEEGKPVSLSSVAERCHLSRGYLEQIAISLKNAKLIRGMPGRKGGYHLSRPADQVRLGEVIEAMIGPVTIVECIDSPEDCTKSEGCQNRLVYSLLNRKIRDVLYGCTIADLLDPGFVDTLAGTEDRPSLKMTTSEKTSRI